MRAGGYDNVDARVEIEYPLVGLGRFTAERRGETLDLKGETVEGTAALLNQTNIPTGKIVIPLNDDAS